MKSMVSKNFLRSVLLIAVATGFAGAANAATLEWQLPTTYANGAALPAAEIASIKIYKQGSTAAIATLAGSITTYAVPDCVGATYTATATATNGFESDPSTSASVTPLRVTCAPKSPAAVAVH